MADQGGPGKIRVRRAIYNVAEALDKEAKKNGQEDGIGIAQQTLSRYEAEGDTVKAALWYAVWAYLMEVYCGDKTETEIIED